MGITEYIHNCNGFFTHENMSHIINHYTMLKKGERIEFPMAFMMPKDMQIFCDMFMYSLKHFVG